MTNSLFKSGDCICSAVDAGNGTYRASVEVKGWKLAPTRPAPHIYLSEERFKSESEAIHHGIDYINEHFPESGNV